MSTLFAKSSAGTDNIILVDPRSHPVFYVTSDYLLARYVCVMTHRPNCMLLFSPFYIDISGQSIVPYEVLRRTHCFSVAEGTPYETNFTRLSATRCQASPSAGRQLLPFDGDSLRLRNACLDFRGLNERREVVLCALNDTSASLP